MPVTGGRLPTVDAVLSTPPPPRLFHYTSPAGLLGIAKLKTLWATHVGFLNDAKELRHAAEVARLVVSNRLEAPAYQGHYSDEERQFLRHVADYAGSASSDIYVGSLTEERDLLSQWRAYCPAGGYSIGFSSARLAAMAGTQGFFLSPCVYEWPQQYTLMTEIITYHVQQLHEFAVGGGSTGASDLEKKAVECAREISRYGSILKHRSFHEEREWRLISISRGVNHSSIQHRPGRTSIIPYLEFSLQDAAHPDLTRHLAEDSLTIVIGPSTNYEAASFAVQSLGHKYFPPGCALGGSEIPYRGT